MEFLYCAFTNSETIPIKGKISKWRHLESMITQLILLGLVFFVILQNGNIKKSMNEKLSHELIEDIINDRISLLNKQLDDVRQTILTADRKSQLQVQQVKLLIRVLAKEFGLPLPEDEEKRGNIQQQKDQTAKNKYTVTEQEDQQNSEEISQYEQSGFSAEDEYNDRQEEDEQQEESEEQIDQNQEEVIVAVQNSVRKQYNSDLRNEENQKEGVNLDNSTDEHEKNNGSEDGQKQVRNTVFGNYEDQIKGLISLISHFFIISLALVCIFIIISFVKNPKSRKIPEQTLEQMLKIGRSKKNESLKMSKKEFLKLQ